MWKLISNSLLSIELKGIKYRTLLFFCSTSSKNACITLLYAYFLDCKTKKIIHFNTRLFMVGYLLLFVLFSTNFIVFDNNKTTTKTYEGYVITELEDTLYGKLEMLSPTMNQVKVKFIDKDDKRITYKAKELKAYAFEAEIWNRKEKRNVQEWIFYTKKTVERPPIPFRGNDILMQHEVRGNINMYNYYVETRTSQTMEHLVYIDKEGVLYDISQKNYRKILKSLMGDYPVVYHKIGTKGYTFKFLSKIIKEYNQQSLKQGDRIMTVDRN